jgi:hypothetical protein
MQLELIYFGKHNPLLHKKCKIEIFHEYAKTCIIMQAESTSS